MEGINARNGGMNAGMSPEGGGGGGGTTPAKMAVSITYAALKALRNGGNLVPGTWYRITDYACTTKQENTQSANHAFDIIVRADDENHLNENALAAHHDGDTYFADCKLEAWELKYSLDNDTNRFAWAEDGAGDFYVEYVIKKTTFRIKRTEIISGREEVWVYETEQGTKFTAANPEVGDKIYDDESLSNIFQTITDTETEETEEGKGVVYGMKDEWNNECPYDFKNIMFKRFEITSVLDGCSSEEYPDHPLVGTWGLANDMVTVDEETSEWFYTFSTINEGEVTDASLIVDYNYELSIGSGATENTIKSRTGKKKKLNNIVFVSMEDNLIACHNHFDNECYDMTFGHYNTELSFGSNNGPMTFGSNNGPMTFGSNNGVMSFGSNNRTMSFGSNNYQMSFGSDNGGMSFGSNNYQMTFGSGNYQMSFGSYNYSMSFGSDNYQMTFGSGNNRMSFGSYNYSMSFGSGNHDIEFYSYTCNITVFENVGYCEIIGGSSSDAYVKNAQILNGTEGTFNDPLTIQFTANTNYTQCAAKDSRGNLKIWNPADLVD